MTVEEGNRDGRLLYRIKHWTGLDRAIGFTVLARGWSSAAGIVTIILIAHFLTPDEQGYYYTFASLVAIQIVFELGFSFVIQQMASHERAHLHISADGIISGDERSHARLASVLQKAVRWYSVAFCPAFLVLLPTGLYFFSTRNHPIHSISWRLPWVMISLATVLTFQIDPIFAFLEGCGFVSHVARTRLIQALTGSILAWTALIAHHGLFATAMVIFGQALAGASSSGDVEKCLARCSVTLLDLTGSRGLRRSGPSNGG